MLVAILCSVLIPSRVICADRAPRSDNQMNAHHTVRALEMKIEVIRKSKKIQLTIINHSPDARYHMLTPDLTLVRVKLTDENGRPLKMTAKGIEEFNEPAIGTIRLNEMKSGMPFSEPIDLGPLFEFPQTGTIRCEVSRLVHFTNPLKPPSEKEWMKFPPVNIVIDDVVSPQTPKVPAAPSAPVER